MRTRGAQKSISLAHPIVCVVILSIISLTSISCAQKPVGYNSTDAYDFPVKPGTEAWQAFTNHDEMVKACEIPAPILLNMSIPGLVETVLSYPLLGDMRAYNSIQQGFDAVAGQFNGIPELLNRKDAGTELLARYRTMEPAAIKDNWTLLQKGDYAMGIANIEILLAQYTILDDLTLTQRQELLEETIAKYQIKQKYAEVYGQSGQECTAWLTGRALQQASYAPFEQKIQQDVSLQNFLSTGSFPNDSVFSEIYSQAQQFLSGR
jgi:hypothetical protein